MTSRPAPRAPRTLSPLLLTTAGLLIAGPAVAQTASAPREGDGETTRWGVGLGISADARPYRSLDRKAEALPLLAFENRWVRVAGPGLEVKLLRQDPVSLGLTFSYARDGYKPEDSPMLAGMSSRHASAWLGLRAGMRTPVGLLTAEWTGDTVSHSRGRKLKLGVEQRFAWGEWGLTPRLSATWLDAKFVQYYFGVEAHEALPGRPAYAPGATMNVDAGLRLDWRLDAEQTLFADVGATALGREIRNSPLVDRRTVPGARLGWIYRF